MKQFILAIALGLATFAAGADDTPPAGLTPEQEAAALQGAEAAGLAIYRHDQAAAVASDAGLKVRAFKKDQRVAGWITEERDGQIVVTFIDQTPAALYRVTVGADGKAGKLETLEAPTPLSAYESGAATARTVAVAAGFQPCAQSYNSVVLPGTDPAGAPWVVYLLPGTTDPKVVPLGGSYRFDIKDGKVAAQHAYTRSCIKLDNDPRSVAMMVTHLMDPLPTDVHVFLNLWARKALYVMTPSNGVLWSVENGKIRRAK